MIRKAIIVLLTLCVLWACGISITSYWHNYGWFGYSSGQPGQRPWGGVSVHGGKFTVMYETRPTMGAGQPAVLPSPRNWKWSVLGIRFNYMDYPALSWVEFEMTGPVCIPILLLATYPIIGFAQGPIRRWRRRRKGLCVKCGYDLTGNVTGTCPECGGECQNSAAIEV